MTLVCMAIFGPYSILYLIAFALEIFIIIFFSQISFPQIIFRTLVS